MYIYSVLKVTTHTEQRDRSLAALIEKKISTCSEIFRSRVRSKHDTLKRSACGPLPDL